SLRGWVERLAAYAASSRGLSQVDLWAGEDGGRARPLPVEGPDAANLAAASERVSVVLGAAATRALLHEVPPVYPTEINHLLLPALARASTAWSGGRALRVDLEGHGREEIAPGVDLSRTVGWLTSMFPVLLDLAGAGDLGAALKRVKERLRQIPDRGVGYGAL